LYDLQRIGRRLMQFHRNRGARIRDFGFIERQRRRLGAPVQQTAGLSGKVIEPAHRGLVQGLELQLNGLLVLRQARRHAHQLRPDDGGDGAERCGQHDHDGERGPCLVEAEAAQTANQGCNQQAENERQRDRHQHVAREIEQRQQGCRRDHAKRPVANGAGRRGNPQVL
jgi:hypothetical protein